MIPFNWSVQDKKLQNSSEGKPSTLVIELGEGAKLQVPVTNHAEGVSLIARGIVR